MFRASKDTEKWLFTSTSRKRQIVTALLLPGERSRKLMRRLSRFWILQTEALIATIQSMVPLFLMNGVQAADIFVDTCPTTASFFNTATA